MTQVISSHHPTGYPIDDSQQFIALLESQAPQHPFVGEELARHRVLYSELQHRQDFNEHTLREWRAALTRRWECEIAGQRLFTQIQRQLREHFGTDSLQVEAVAPVLDSNAVTAADLLMALRRMHAGLTLLQPSPPFVAERLSQLKPVLTALAEALEQTRLCEAARRQAVLNQQLARGAYERARNQTRHLFIEQLGEEAIQVFTAGVFTNTP